MSELDTPRGIINALAIGLGMWGLIAVIAYTVYTTGIR